MLQVWRIGRSHRQSDSMQTQLVMSADPRQVLAVRAALGEVVFAVSLKPTNRRKARNDFLMMLGSQADARAQPRVGAHHPLPGSRGEGWRQLRAGGAHG